MNNHEIQHICVYNDHMHTLTQNLHFLSFYTLRTSENPASLQCDIMQAPEINEVSCRVDSVSKGTKMSNFRQDAAPDTNHGGLMSAEPAAMESSGVARETKSPIVTRYV